MLIFNQFINSIRFFSTNPNIVNMFILTLSPRHLQLEKSCFTFLQPNRSLHRILFLLNIFIYIKYSIVRYVLKSKKFVVLLSQKSAYTICMYVPNDTLSSSAAFSPIIACFFYTILFCRTRKIYSKICWINVNSNILCNLKLKLVKTHREENAALSQRIIRKLK